MLCNCTSKICSYIGACGRSVNDNADDVYQTWTDLTYECMWNDTFDYFIPIISDIIETKGVKDVKEDTDTSNSTYTLGSIS